MKKDIKIETKNFYRCGRELTEEIHEDCFPDNELTKKFKRKELVQFCARKRYGVRPFLCEYKRSDTRYIFVSNVNAYTKTVSVNNLYVAYIKLTENETIEIVERELLNELGFIEVDPFEIKHVYYGKTSTTVLWLDGTKTIVKCDKRDKYDEEKGLAMAIAKKALGNTRRYWGTFEKHLPKKEKK